MKAALSVVVFVAASALVSHQFALAQPPPDPADLDLDGVPDVALPPTDPQPPIPSTLVPTGRILIDRSHSNNFDVSGFMNYLVSQGWVIAQHLSGPITESVLAGHDILLVPTRNSNDPIPGFSPSERAAIDAFLESSHGLWVFNDIVPPSGVNTLSQSYGVTFQYDVVRDPTHNEGLLTWPTISELAVHPIVAGVQSYGLYGGDCLSVTSPAGVIGRGDEDAYSFYCPVGSRPPVLAVLDNGGRAVFAGDITPLHPNYYPSRLRPEEQLLLQNIVNWLAGAPPTATEATSWGRVKGLFH